MLEMLQSCQLSFTFDNSLTICRLDFLRTALCIACGRHLLADDIKPILQGGLQEQDLLDTATAHC